MIETIINQFYINFHHSTGQQACSNPHPRREEPDPWNSTYRKLHWKSRSGDGEGLPRQPSWEVADKIIACGFDTTSSNTGVNNGSCTILQNLLHQQLLWLAYRHHILELIIGGAFTTIFGVTSGPKVTTFKILKTSWNSLNLGDRRLPDIPSYFKEDVADILEYVNSKLDQESHLPRGDYKELLELVKLILGGDIERKKGYSYTIQRPGADHHARWMAKGIYTS